LWGGVALAGVGGIAGLIRPGPSPSPTADQTQQAHAPAVPVTVAGFAEVAVRSWLTASEDTVGTVDGLFLIDPDLEPNTLGQRSAGQTTAVAAHALGDGYWAVTVAADVDERGAEGAWQTLGTRYFEVGVVEDRGGRLAAVTAPAMVAAPPTAYEPARPATGGTRTPDPDDPVTQTVDGFFDALLTGAGDLSRYLAPGVDITAVTPPPFIEAAVARQAVEHDQPDRARVRCEVRALTATRATWTLAYEVALAERDGRWEVTTLSGAPTLAATPAERREDQPAPPAATTSSPLPPVPVAPEPGA
jgi:hypothetical protein